MLPRAQRLVRHRDFQATYQRKRRVDHPALTLYVGRGQGTPRLGFVVSKKAAGKAHDRNLIKRRLRALCLPLLVRLANHDLVIVVRTPALALEFGALKTILVQLFQQARVWTTGISNKDTVGDENTAKAKTTEQAPRSHRPFGRGGRNADARPHSWLSACLPLHPLHLPLYPFLL